MRTYLFLALVGAARLVAPGCRRGGAGDGDGDADGDGDGDGGCDCRVAAAGGTAPGLLGALVRGVLGLD